MSNNLDPNNNNIDQTYNITPNPNLNLITNQNSSEITNISSESNQPNSIHNSTPVANYNYNSANQDLRVVNNPQQTNNLQQTPSAPTQNSITISPNSNMYAQVMQPPNFYLTPLFMEYPQFQAYNAPGGNYNQAQVLPPQQQHQQQIPQQLHQYQQPQYYYLPAQQIQQHQQLTPQQPQPTQQPQQHIQQAILPNSYASSTSQYQPPVNNQVLSQNYYLHHHQNSRASISSNKSSNSSNSSNNNNNNSNISDQQNLNYPLPPIYSVPHSQYQQPIQQAPHQPINTSPSNAVSAPVNEQHYGEQQVQSSTSSTSTDPVKKNRKRRHTATVHDMTPQTAERNRCRICNKQFKRPSSLQTHYYSHTGEKIFKCPWIKCGKFFSVKSNMTRHYKLHERDFKKFQDAPNNVDNENETSSSSYHIQEQPASQQQQQLPSSGVVASASTTAGRSSIGNQLENTSGVVPYSNQPQPHTQPPITYPTYQSQNIDTNRASVQPQLPQFSYQKPLQQPVSYPQQYTYNNTTTSTSAVGHSSTTPSLPSINSNSNQTHSTAQNTTQPTTSQAPITSSQSSSSSEPRQANYLDSYRT
ncbi:uncharacterized protein KGF55_004293 [Candida pseudojiufengensis]|uniref:uncharacterized protein n=1 Tax=Candida pseudojiufengensis TaxID=497109 RepID=UPI00222485C0|nr:uncharacterized protein KGF55_004293 [Candida pseudojiufengensis]KAI5961026.1 hypothetical protein KGF55_004293 [Candida pseudojiufengensis]